MIQSSKSGHFQSINQGYDRVFHPDNLSLGLVVPIERYDTSPVPTMDRHIERIQLAEKLGFSAIWLRDVPFNVPSFGDAGQTFDPFVYLGFISAKTDTIALGVASIILPLRHPISVAKAAATADLLSDGRLILGVASGDRPEEYPAHNIPFEDRGRLFRESFEFIRKLSEPWASFENSLGINHGQMDMLPKPTGGKLPLLITGGSQQNEQWLTMNGDGRMLYPRPIAIQSRIIQRWRSQMRYIQRTNQPVLEPLYIDLVSDPDAPPSPIHLGLRLGVKALSEHLRQRQEIGVNHVAINLRYNKADIEETMNRLADIVLPEFQREVKQG